MKLEAFALTEISFHVGVDLEACSSGRLHCRSYTAPNFSGNLRPLPKHRVV